MFEIWGNQWGLISLGSLSKSSTIFHANGGGNSNGVIADLLDFDIIASNFELLGSLSD